MKPKAGHDYVTTAGLFAAERGPGTFIYSIDPAAEKIKVAYPTTLFDRNITDSQAMMRSILIALHSDQGMGDVDQIQAQDFYIPPAYSRLLHGPASSVTDMWRILGGWITDTIIKPMLDLRRTLRSHAVQQRLQMG